MEQELEPETKTRLHVIRVSSDLREMLNAIAAFEMSTQIEVSDTLLRPVIEARFAQLPIEMQNRTQARILAAAE